MLLNLNSTLSAAPTSDVEQPSASVAATAGAVRELSQKLQAADALQVELKSALLQAQVLPLLSQWCPHV